MRVSTAVFAVFLSLSGAAAQAQEIAGRLDQLRVLVKPGETIHLKGIDGDDVKGQFVGLSPDSIRILTKGGPRDFAASDVDLVTASRHGSLATGAKWGL